MCRALSERANERASSSEERGTNSPRHDAATTVDRFLADKVTPPSVSCTYNSSPRLSRLSPIGEPRYRCAFIGIVQPRIASRNAHIDSARATSHISHCYYISRVPIY